MSRQVDDRLGRQRFAEPLHGVRFLLGVDRTGLAGVEFSHEGLPEFVRTRRGNSFEIRTANTAVREREISIGPFHLVPCNTVYLIKVFDGHCGLPMYS